VPAQQWDEAQSQNRLSVDGRQLDLGEKSFGGMVVNYITLGRTEPPIATDINILHMDDELIVLQKPAPLAVHPCGRFNKNTLLSFAKLAWPAEDLRPAHRIDAATTGILVLTRNKVAAHFVQSQFQKREVHKTYLVRVEGCPKHEMFTVDSKIDLATGEQGRRKVSPEGADAQTDFKVAAHLDDGTTLLYAHPISGRTNQIRLHLQDYGLPIVGDNAYGSEEDVESGMVSQEQTLNLHAHAISFRHPADDRMVTFESSPPQWASGAPSNK
jgi:RluA family pseudouridine synthase